MGNLNSELTLIIHELRKLQKDVKMLVAQNEQDYYTPKQLAEKIPLNPKTISMYCSTGKIKGQKTEKGRAWLIPNSEYKRLVEEMSKY